VEGRALFTLLPHSAAGLIQYLQVQCLSFQLRTCSDFGGQKLPKLVVGRYGFSPVAGSGVGPHQGTVGAVPLGVQLDAFQSRFKCGLRLADLQLHLSQAVQRPDQLAV